ncbi:MAG: hypothetical protein ACPL5F_09170 [Moorellaceae bacterium]
MQGNLVLIFQEDEVNLLFGQEGIVLAEEKCPRALPPENIQSFFCHHGITPTEVQRVLVAADLTTLLWNAESALGYLRLTSAPLELTPVSELLKKKSFQLYTFELPLPGQPGYRSKLEKALAHLVELPVKNLAINSASSPLDPAPEQEVMETIEKLFPRRFTFYSSYRYHLLNFLLRENALLIDAFLSDQTKSFCSWLENLLASSGISAPIYFLKGDGTLTGHRMALAYPLLTWQAILASYLLASSWWVRQGETFVVPPGREGLALGLTERYLPKLSTGLTGFHGVELAGSYPHVIRFPERPHPHSWEKTLEALNPLPGPIPVVCWAEPQEIPRTFRYPVLSPPADPALQGAGVLAAPYGMEIEKVCFFSDHRQIQLEKQGLWDMALYQLRQDSVELKEMVHQFEEIPLRYLPQNACRLKLKVWGRF